MAKLQMRYKLMKNVNKCDRNGQNWVRKMVALSGSFFSDIINKAEKISSKILTKYKNNWRFNLEEKGNDF